MLFIHLAEPRRADARELSTLRKVLDEWRNVLLRLAEGESVPLEDARNAVFYAVAAATTARGQSMERRKCKDAGERLWACIQSYAGVALPTRKYDAPESTDREEVEAWLDS
jgi:hypothetical protein